MEIKKEYLLGLPGNWNWVDGYRGIYLVSDLGVVISIRSGEPRILKQFKSDVGYCRVSLIKDKKSKLGLIHRLVLFAFIGPPPNGMQAAHLNGIPYDNRLINLKWCTSKENNSHKIYHGTYFLGGGNSKLKKCKHGHRFTKTNTYYKKVKNGRTHRQCRICARATLIRFRKKAKEAIEQAEEGEGMSNRTLFNLLDALVVIGVVLAICMGWIK